MPSLYITRSMKRVVVLVLALFVAFCCNPHARPQITVLTDLTIAYILEVGFGLYDEFHSDIHPDSLISVAFLLIPLVLGIGAGIGGAITINLHFGLVIASLVSITIFGLLKILRWISNS